MRIEDVVVLYIGLSILLMVIIPGCWFLLWVFYELANSLAGALRRAREYLSTWRNGRV